jgi:hypothetical protein
VRQEDGMAGVTAWEDNLDGWFEYNVKFAQETLVERGNVGHMLTMHTRLGNVIPVSAVCTARSNPAPRHAPIRHLKTLESGTPSRSNPAPENGRKRHLITE